MESRIAAVARALADPTRLRILTALGGGAQLSCGELVELCPVGQSTVSHHLKALVECGLVAVEPAGQRSLYRLRAPALRELAASIASLAGCEARASRATRLGASDPGQGLPDLGPGIVD